MPMIFLLLLFLFQGSFAQSPITFSVTVKKPNCYGEKGKVVFNDISGGVAPYRYAARLIDEQGADCEFNDQCNPTTGGFCVTGHCITTSEWIQSSSNNSVKLNAGEIEAIVIDAVGTEAIKAVTMTQPPNLVLTTTVTDAICNGGNGELEIDISGGKAGYTIKNLGVFNFPCNLVCPPTPITVCGETYTKFCLNEICGYHQIIIPGNCELGKISNPAGTYLIDISDANGCEIKDTVIIAEPPKLVLTTTVTDAICNGGNGEVEVNVEGGKAPYHVLFSSPPCANSCSTNSQCPNLCFIDECGNPNCMQCISGCCSFSTVPCVIPYWRIPSPAGSYVIEITDANGCTLNDTVIIAEPPKLVLVPTIKNPMCHGEAGEMEFELSGGKGPYAITVTSGQPCLTNQDCSNLNTTICGEYLGAACIWGHCTLPQPPGPCEFGKVSASAGSYSVMLTDANNCEVVDTIIITEPPAIIVNVTPSGNVKACKGSQLTLAASTNAAVSQFDWLKDGLIIPGQHQQTLMVVEDGSYAVKITDITGCSEMSGDTKVTFKKPPKATITQQPCQNGAVKLLATEGANFMYRWKKGNKFIDGATLNTYLATVDAKYKVEVTNSTGCSKLSGPSEVVISCRQGSITDKNLFTSVSLYPNPNGGSFSIDVTTSDAADQVANIVIVNLLGQSIYEEQVTLTGGHIKKDVSLDHSLSDGIYQVQVLVNEKIYTEKVIVQRK